jgi:hypothetical protein
MTVSCYLQAIILIEYTVCHQLLVLKKGSEEVLLSPAEFSCFVREDVKSKLIAYFDHGQSVVLSVSDDVSFEDRDKKYFIRKIISGEYIENDEKMFLIAEISKKGKDHELLRVVIEIRFRRDHTEALIHFTS